MEDTFLIAGYVVYAVDRTVVLYVDSLSFLFRKRGPPFIAL